MRCTNRGSNPGLDLATNRESISFSGEFPFWESRVIPLNHWCFFYEKLLFFVFSQFKAQKKFCSSPVAQSQSTGLTAVERTIEHEREVVKVSQKTYLEE